ncbi:BTAD domain-containing putative transcriptional regulator [Dactylosporangium sp. NPDC050588]|uniref:BTAD domain-containing putative transcriptional regulator n=1 Tax=Dactylosporangium sp. NPDC050588 TaxID=3157211 RepID=UPI0033E259FF
MRIRLLGDVGAWTDGERGEAVDVDIGHERQRCVLAALLVEPGRPVPADVLLDRAWGDRLPRHPREALYSYVSRLRQSLAPGGWTVVRRPSGYVVQIDPLAVDLHLFDDLVRRAAGTDDVAAAASLLDEALRLWTGDAFGCLDTPWLSSVRRDLHRRRRTAEQRRDDLALRLGRHASVVDGLLDRADADPLDEVVTASAMLALYRCGRRGEALGRYDVLRRQLAGQLGIEPGEQLRRLHRQILQADPALSPPLSTIAITSNPLIGNDPQTPATNGIAITSDQQPTAHLPVRRNSRSAPLAAETPGTPTIQVDEPGPCIPAAGAVNDAADRPAAQGPMDVDGSPSRQGPLRGSAAAGESSTTDGSTTTDGSSTASGSATAGGPGAANRSIAAGRSSGVGGAHMLHPLVVHSARALRDASALPGGQRASGEPNTAGTPGVQEAPGSPSTPATVGPHGGHEASSTPATVDPHGGREASSTQGEGSVQDGRGIQVLPAGLGGASVPGVLGSPGVFSGRQAQLAELTSALRGATRGGDLGKAGDDGTDAANATRGIVVIGGAGGIGKTWLALRWAHEHRRMFPDGQLNVNLRGFDPAGEPLCPSVATRMFLTALGVAADALPAGADEQAMLYRRLVAHRRMLVLLDNAHDSAQVVPLLPGTPTVAVLVTSRRRLTGLVAAHGAHPVTLECMTDPDAADLLRARLGAARAEAEPEAVRALLPLCGGLPLALGIVAARAATDPHCRLATLVNELRARRTRLDALDAGDLAVSLRAAIAGSVRHLSAAAGALFGRLSLAPGPDIGAGATASMSGCGPEALRPAVRELLDANLLAEETPGRFRMHDLVRLYGMELAAGTDGARPAVERLLDHYVRQACAAALRLEPLRDPLPGVGAWTCPDRRAALAWFAAEDQVLASAVRYAAGAGFDRHAWQLAWALVYVLDQRGDWHAQADVHRTALRSARRLGDDAAIAHSLRGLARAYTWLRCFDQARDQLRVALAASRRLGDLAGQGFAFRGLARVSAWQGEPGRALADDRRALAMFEAAGHDHGRAQTLNALGWHLAHLGEHEQALACCAQAIELHRRLGDRHGEGITWDTLAYSRHRSGMPDEAVGCYRRAAALLREHGDRYQEAVVTGHLGDTYAALGRTAEARTAWLCAAALLDALGHPDAPVARAKTAITGNDNPEIAEGGRHTANTAHAV